METKNKKNPSIYIKKTRYVFSLIIVLVGLIALIGGTSYAVLKGDFADTKEQVIKSGSLELVLTENYQDINAKIAVLQDENGLLQDTTYDFTIENTGSIPVKYDLKLVNETPSSYTGNVLAYDYIKVGLAINGKEYGPMSLKEVNNIIDANSINPEEKKSYKMRLWLDSAKATELANMSTHSAFLKLKIEAEQSIESGIPETPEECFEIAITGEIFDYYCGDTTEGTTKYHDVVIPEEFEYGHMYLNQTDWDNIKQWLVTKQNYTETDAETAVNTAIENSAGGNYEEFFNLLTMYKFYGGKLTTTKQKFGFYTYLNKPDQEKIEAWLVSNMEMSETEASNTVAQAIADAKEDNIQMLHALTIMYQSTGGKMTTQMGYTEKIKPTAIYVVFNDTGYTGAFQDEGLTSVVLPDSIEVINDVAFRYNNLTEVTLPNNLTTLGEYAFANNKLTHVIIPNNVQVINTHAFAYNKLKTVQLGTSTESQLTNMYGPFLKNNTSNLNLTKIINKTGKSFDFYRVIGTTASSGVTSTFEKGTIISEYGNIEVVTE